MDSRRTEMFNGRRVWGDSDLNSESADLPTTPLSRRADAPILFASMGLYAFHYLPLLPPIQKLAIGINSVVKRLRQPTQG